MPITPLLKSIEKHLNNRVQCGKYLFSRPIPPIMIAKNSKTITTEDTKVSVSGWVQDVRNLGGISFLTLRDRYGTIQVTMPKKKIEPTLFETLTHLSRESVLTIDGEIKESNQTASGYEIIPEGVTVHSNADVPLPMGVIDKVNVEMDTRLNNRFMDLRKPEIRAIFEIRSAVIDLISSYMVSNGFVNVCTPKIGASGAEGGATLFNVDYFGKKAYLSQSPQLYKQMLMSTGLDRIFEIGPAFRAENSNTNRHVTEFTSFDGEMSWIENEEEVMEMIGRIIDHVLRGIKEGCRSQLEILGKEIDVPALPYPVLTYSECLGMISGMMDIKEGDDLGTEGERLVGDIMAERGFPLYFIKEYPEEAKPFYIMERDGTSYSYSFDLDYKGQEISSGGQREHRYDRLVERMAKKGLGPEEFESYLGAFKYGMPPHGGWGIGVDRFVSKVLDLPNVREAILFPRDVSRLMP